jgi:hypothetical protein
MPHLSTKRRKPAALTRLIPLAFVLVAATLGLAACGGSSSTTTQTAANAAAAGTVTGGTTSSGSASSGTSSSGTSSGATPPAGAPPGGPNPGRFTAVRECLSKKGITLPRRTPGAPGGPLGGAGGTQLPKGMTRTQFTEALKSCGATNRFGNGTGRFRRGFNNPRFHQVLTRFAACLRQNGINVGEPNTSGKGPIFDTKGINTGSPQFRAASAKCRSTLFSAIRPKATPGTATTG